MSTMSFLITLLIIYGLSLGICRLFTIIIPGTYTDIIKIVALIPILNTIATVIVILFIFFLVKDYRNSQKKLQEKK
jgi:UPF0716 family protein affecting phage T7 exclusion